MNIKTEFNCFSVQKQKLMKQKEEEQTKKKNNLK